MNGYEKFKELISQNDWGRQIAADKLLPHLNINSSTLKTYKDRLNREKGLIDKDEKYFFVKEYNETLEKPTPIKAKDEKEYLAEIKEKLSKLDNPDSYLKAQFGDLNTKSLKRKIEKVLKDYAFINPNKIFKQFDKRVESVEDLVQYFAHQKRFFKDLDIFNDMKYFGLYPRIIPLGATSKRFDSSETTIRNRALDLVFNIKEYKDYGRDLKVYTDNKYTKIVKDLSKPLVKLLSTRIDNSKIEDNSYVKKFLSQYKYENFNLTSNQFVFDSITSLLKEYISGEINILGDSELVGTVSDSQINKEVKNLFDVLYYS